MMLSMMLMILFALSKLDVVLTKKIGFVTDNQTFVTELLVQKDFTTKVIPKFLSTEYKWNAPTFKSISQVKSDVQSANISAIIGNYNPGIAMVAESLGLPYLVTSLSHNTPYQNVFHVAATSDDVADCCNKLTNKNNWNYHAVLYTFEDESFLLHLHIKAAQSSTVFQAWGLDNITDVQQTIVDIRQMEIRKILVKVPHQYELQILEQARRYSMLAEPFKWIFVKEDDVNDIHDILRDIDSNVTLIKCPKQDDLMTDAIDIAVKSLRKNIRKMTKNIQSVNVTGNSGYIEFSDDGKRTNYDLDIYRYKRNEFLQVGQWTRRPKGTMLLYSETNFSNFTAKNFTLRGRHLRVVSLLEEPWLMYKQNDTTVFGIDRYEGYVIDIVNNLSRSLGFTYELYEVPDGEFGAKNEDGTWTGLMGELLNGNADMLVASLSINADREKAADFTKPFHTRSINVLIKTESREAFLFQFIKPLSTIVWAMILGSIVVVSIIMVLAEKLGTPLTHDTSNTRGTESVWFVVSSLLQGGIDSAPLTVAGRILSFTWWFYSLIIISSYTANLTAFLTVHKINPPVSSLNDLSKQTKIAFGTVRHSGVEDFFKQSRIEPYSKMWDIMEANPDFMVNSTEEAMVRVKEGSYAFIWDNTVTKYKVTKDCELTLIGPDFDQKGFGIGLPPGSVFRDQLSIEVLKLGDDGFLTEYINRWWHSSLCPAETPVADDTTELTIDHIAGIFITLLAGVILTIIIMFMDCIYRKFRGNRNKRPSVLTRPMTLNGDCVAAKTLRKYRNESDDT